MAEEISAPGLVGPLVLDADDASALRLRLARVQGQVGAMIRMLDDERDCRDLARLMGAASAALDRAGVLVLHRALRQCVDDPQRAADLPELEKLFLELS